MASEKKDRRGTAPGSRKGTKWEGHQGNLPFEPTDQMRADVRTWIKITDAGTIALKLGISRDTLDRHFKQELADGRFEAIGQIGGNLIKKAMAGNLTAMIFYLRTQGKWNTRIEHTGIDGGPISHFDAAAFLAGLPIEEQRLVRPLIEKMLHAAGIDPDGDDVADAAG